ncbi:MAG: glycosyltransferase family 2 protein [Elusimicrobiota bacterium]
MGIAKKSIPDELSPLVSVCIPTYNRAAKLERAVQALLNCDYSNIEVLISDNASPDHTSVVCERFMALDKRVKYHRHQRNMGGAFNFFYARSMAKGKYFLWHGDDDFLDSKLISKCVEMLEVEGELVLVSGLAAYHRGDMKITHYGNIIQLQSDHPWLRAFKYLWLVKDNSIFCGVYRVDSVKECEAADIFPGDWAWIIEVLLTGKARVLPDLFVYREFGNTLSSSKKGYSHFVRVTGLPTWYAIFPWIAKSRDVGLYFIERSKITNRYKFCKKYLFSFCIVGLLLARGAYGFPRRILSMIPFARTLYYRCFHKYGY